MSLPERAQDALSHAESFPRVGVVRADFDARQLRDGDLFGGVVEKDEVELVAGILRADEMRECHGDALCRREAVFAVQDHGVRAVEQDDGGAGGLVVGLLDVEVGVLEVENAGVVGRPFASEDGVEGLGDIEVEGVAEFVGLGGAVGFDAGGLVERVMAAEGGFAERAEEVAQGFEAEEVHRLVGDFKAGVFGVAVALLTWALGLGVGGLGVEEGLVLHALNDFFDKLLLAFFGELFVLLLRVFIEELAGVERLADGVAEVLHGVGGVGELRPGVVEAGVEEEIGQGFHEVFEVEAGGEVAGEFCVTRELHAGESLVCLYRLDDLHARKDSGGRLWVAGSAGWQMEDEAGREGVHGGVGYAGAATGVVLVVEGAEVEQAIDTDVEAAAELNDAAGELGGRLAAGGAADVLMEIGGGDAAAELGVGAKPELVRNEAHADGNGIGLAAVVSGRERVSAVEARLQRAEAR